MPSGSQCSPAQAELKVGRPTYQPTSEERDFVRFAASKGTPDGWLPRRRKLCHGVIRLTRSFEQPPLGTAPRQCHRAADASSQLSMEAPLTTSGEQACPHPFSISAMTCFGTGCPCRSCPTALRVHCSGHAQLDGFPPALVPFDVMKRSRSFDAGRLDTRRAERVLEECFCLRQKDAFGSRCGQQPRIEYYR
jgi:hypothetical protein